MRILTLQVENIKRVSAAYINAADDAVVTISGRNGHGKSSCIDAIAMALGGAKLCPPEPLRRGELAGHVTVDLGAYRITRRFWRRDAADDAKSSLEVTSPEGATYKSPQALLDKLVSDLTFDPLAFLDLGPKDQREYVRAFVGLDFRALDAQRAAALEAVRECETVLKVAEHDVKAGEYYPDAPAAPVDAAALLEQMAAAERAERAAVEAEQAVEAQRRTYTATAETLRAEQQTIDTLVQQLTAARGRAAVLEAALRQQQQDGETLRAAADTARAAVPDTAALRADLAAANTINAQVQANRRHTALLDARDAAHADLRQARQRISAIDAQKQAQLTAAVFPVPGLSFSDDGLMFDGLPFEQASYAQQLRVAVAMGLASNPTLKVLLIKHGNALDRSSLALLTTMAEEAGAQVWVERVAESADGVSVFIEDGAIVRPPSPDLPFCRECGAEWHSPTSRACSCDAPGVRA